MPFVTYLEKIVTKGIFAWASFFRFLIFVTKGIGTGKLYNCVFSSLNYLGPKTA